MISRFLRRTALVACIFTFAVAFAATDYEVFVGTYTGPHSKGIYSFRFDPIIGKAGPVELAAETNNPSFLAVDKQGKYLYAVNELDEYKGAKSGAVSVFSIDPATGTLKFEQQVASLGGAPAYLTLDKTGRALLVANYNGGNVVVFPITANGQLGEHSALDQHSGSGPDRERQEGPHAHSVQMTNDNRFAMSADLGLDKVIIDKFDPIHR
ncbi:MAG TPA: beta-propeller fold lactonase family protein, partial [Terriglobales bacterium]|nr:beta-propeller fold lactonase family protein [Terriglobales bacterium]